jgi:hypothetical protein
VVGLSLTGAFREAAPFPIPRQLVEECLLESDDRFRLACRDGLTSLPPAERRGRLSIQTGLIAESVTTLLLQDTGLDVFAELAAAGVHGVDLLALTPGGQVMALEVKGTLRPTATPRLGRGRLRQMSLDWLSSPGNPAMVEWDLAGLDVYGGLAFLNFAAMDWRIALTHDLVVWLPVRSATDLLDLEAG